MHAAHQPATVARAIPARHSGIAASPYFWSDQFGLRLQHVGLDAGWARVVIDGDQKSLEARYLGPDGGLSAALLVN